MYRKVEKEELFKNNNEIKEYKHMDKTYPNQKNVVIHKDYPKNNFLQISNDHWMEINKRYTPYGLQLYLYLAKNANNYQLALSPAAAEQEAGIKRTTFNKYIGLFIEAGYLVWRSGNTYDFYETPHEPKKKEANGISAGNPLDDSAGAFNISHDVSAELEKKSSTNIEIDKIYAWEDNDDR